MKAILKYPLYRRVSPSNEVEAKGYVAEGTVIDIEKIVEGIPIDDISSWYLGVDGFYYWGGGIEQLMKAADPLKPAVVPIVFPTIAVDWKMNFLGLPDDWLALTGNGVKVAVIDSGVDIGHPDIAGNIVSPKDLTQSSSSMTDTEGHGTAIAGIIGGNATHANGIKGVAPECRIIPVKVLRNTFDLDGLRKNIVAGIEHAISEKADVINISYDLTAVQSPQLTNAIQKASDAGIVLVASAGDVDELLMGVSFPGSDPRFISIGASTDFFVEQIIQKKPANLGFLGGFKDIDTTAPAPKQYDKVSGSSFCAAFVSGVAALLVARAKAGGGGAPSRTQLITMLSQAVADRSQLNKPNVFSFLKITS